MDRENWEFLFSVYGERLARLDAAGSSDTDHVHHSDTSSHPSLRKPSVSDDTSGQVLRHILAIPEDADFRHDRESNPVDANLRHILLCFQVAFCRYLDSFGHSIDRGSATANISSFWSHAIPYVLSSGLLRPSKEIESFCAQRKMAIQFGIDFQELPFIKFHRKAVVMKVHSDRKDRDWTSDNVSKWLANSTWDPIATERRKWKLVQNDNPMPPQCPEFDLVDAELLVDAQLPVDVQLLIDAQLLIEAQLPQRWHENVKRIEGYLKKTTLEPLFTVWWKVSARHSSHAHTVPHHINPRQHYGNFLQKVNLAMPPSVGRFVRSWNIAARMCDKAMMHHGQLLSHYTPAIYRIRTVLQVAIPLLHHIAGKVSEESHFVTGHLREGLFLFDGLYSWAIDLNEGEIAGHERGIILDAAEFLMGQDVDFRFYCHILEKFESDNMEKAISHLHKLYPHLEKDFEQLFSA